VIYGEERGVFSTMRGSEYSSWAAQGVGQNFAEGNRKKRALFSIGLLILVGSRILTI